MDKVQESVIKCCGVNSYKDYVYTSGGNATVIGNSTSTTQYKVPKSCCKDGKTDGCKNDQVITDATTDTGFYTDVSAFYLVSLHFKQ